LHECRFVAVPGFPRSKLPNAQALGRGQREGGLAEKKKKKKRGGGGGEESAHESQTLGFLLFARAGGDIKGRSRRKKKGEGEGGGGRLKSPWWCISNKGGKEKGENGFAKHDSFAASGAPSSVFARERGGKRKKGEGGGHADEKGAESRNPTIFKSRTPNNGQAGEKRKLLKKGKKKKRKRGVRRSEGVAGDCH